jgi:hypothetical protein
MSGDKHIFDGNSIDRAYHDTHTIVKSIKSLFRTASTDMSNDPRLRALRGATSATSFLEMEKELQRTQLAMWVPDTFHDALESIVESSGRETMSVWYHAVVPHHRCMLFNGHVCVFHEQIAETTSFQQACHRTIELIAELWEAVPQSHGGALTKSASKR